MSWCGERKVNVDYSNHDREEHPLINARLEKIEKELKEMEDLLDARLKYLETKYENKG